MGQGSRGRGQGKHGGYIAFYYVFAFVVLAGCGYYIGAGGSSLSHTGEGHPSRTMAMPLLDNMTAEPLLGEIVSERLKGELLAAGPWRIVNAGQRPELLLSGRVNMLKSTPVAFDADSKATEYQMEIHVELTLTRTADGSTIWSAPELVGFADFYVDKDNLTTSLESKQRAFQDAGQRVAESAVQQLALQPDALPAGVSPQMTSGTTDGTTGGKAGAPTTPPTASPPAP